MKVVIDLDLCQGHGVCADEAPEVFRVVKSGDGTYAMAEILIAEPDAALHTRVEAAVKYCPNRALSIQRPE